MAVAFKDMDKAFEKMNEAYGLKPNSPEYQFSDDPKKRFDVNAAKKWGDQVNK